MGVTAGRIAAIAAALAANCGAAWASGGLDCTADDAKAAFTLHGGVTHGMGGPLFAFEGNLEIKDKAIAEDLRRTAFAREHVAQYWFDGDDLRLGLYREREAEKPFGSVELIVKTRTSDEEGSTSGAYEITVFDGVVDGAGGKETKFSGEVECFTE